MASGHLAAGGNIRPNDSHFGAGDVADIGRYIELGPLGHTFAAEQRHVLLIDEVDTLDKLEAHIPFPGALLKTEQDVDALQRYDAKGGKYPARWADLGPRYNQ